MRQQYSGGDVLADNNYTAVNIICPYFLTQGKRNITCEGILEETKVSQMFVSEVQKLVYQENNCYSNGTKCPIARLAAEKYMER